jgi:hypothetical protein
VLLGNLWLALGRVKKIIKTKMFSTEKNTDLKMKHRFTFDLDNALRSKPQEGDGIVGRVNNSLKYQKEVTIKEFCDMVVTSPENGAHSFISGWFKGKRNANNWIGGNSAWCLDFDSNIPFEYIKAAFADYGLRVNVCYASFSDTPEYRKFRVVIFVNARLEKNVKMFAQIQKNIMSVVKYGDDSKDFKVSDKSCKDVCRLFFPGKELIYLDEVENDYKDFTKFYNVSDVRNAGKNKTNPVTPYELDLTNIADCILENSEQRETQYAIFNDGKHIEHFNWTKCLESVEIVKKFENLELLVTDKLHNQILNLAIFYSKIKGGLLRMKNVMLAFNEKNAKETTMYGGVVVPQQYKQNKFNCLTAAATKWYYPTKLNSFSDYGNDVNINQNIFDYFDEKVKQIEVYPRITLSEAEQKLELAFNDFCMLNKREHMTTETMTQQDILDFFVPVYEKEYAKELHFINTAHGWLYHFICATGLGKTEHILKLNGSYVIAFPTNALKNEAFERFKAKNGERVKVCKTPDLPLFSAEVQNYLDVLYENDLHTEATAFIFMLGKKQDYEIEHDDSLSAIENFLVNKSSFKSIENLNYTADDIYNAFKYRNELIAAYMSKDAVVFTTHKKASIINFTNASAVVFDEDPFDCIYNLNTFNADDLQVFIDNADDTDTADALIKFQTFLRLVGLYLPAKMPQKTEWFAENFAAINKYIGKIKNINKKEVVKSKKTKLLAFLGCHNFVFDDKKEVVRDTRVKRTSNEPMKMFEFCTITSFAHYKNKNVAILSATVKPDMYVSAFPDHTQKVVEILDVEKVGFVSQFCGVSLTRRNMQDIIADKQKVVTENAKGVEYTMKKFDVFNVVHKLPTITFKDYKTFFKNAHKEMHLGNCCGFDSLKGVDIAVCGVYNRPSFVYIMVAQAMGYKVNITNIKMQYLNIKYNGYRFGWVSFADENLKNIQCYFINRETVQAIGRARTLRYNCSVNVIGGFPVREADIVTSNEFKLYETSKENIDTHELKKTKKFDLF